MVHRGQRISNREVFLDPEKNLRESAPRAAHHSVMRISEMNWMMVEEYLKRDDRCVLPLGSTEQHAYLSLSVDSILAERLATEVGALANVPVFPVQPYGITPYFRAFPGTITLRAYLKEGNWGGVYQRSDEEMMKIWRVAVQETLELLNNDWAK